MPNNYRDRDQPFAAHTPEGERFARLRSQPRNDQVSDSSIFYGVFDQEDPEDQREENDRFYDEQAQTEDWSGLKVSDQQHLRNQTVGQPEGVYVENVYSYELEQQLEAEQRKNQQLQQDLQLHQQRQDPEFQQQVERNIDAYAENRGTVVIDRNRHNAAVAADLQREMQYRAIEQQRFNESMERARAEDPDTFDDLAWRMSQVPDNNLMKQNLGAAIANAANPGRAFLSLRPTIHALSDPDGGWAGPPFDPTPQGRAVSRPMRSDNPHRQLTQDELEASDGQGMGDDGNIMRSVFGV